MAKMTGTKLACILFLTVSLGSCGQKTATEVQSSLPQVRAAGQIRCGYILYSSYMKRDPLSGQLSGIFYDLVEEIGKNSHLKIIWAEEIGYENIFPALDSRRFDVFCGGLWANSTRAQAGTFSVPAFFSPILAWTRWSDEGLPTIESIVTQHSKIAVIDGAMEDLIARTSFPTNERFSIPELSPFSLNFENIISKKADVTFAEPSTVAEYETRHPNTLKEIPAKAPMRIFGNALVVKKGDFQLKELLDFAIEEVVLSGRMDQILKKYENTPGAFRRVALPYIPVNQAESSKP